MSSREVTDMISARVRKSEPTAKVLLFGSRARGDARPDSDWDVMVLINDDAVDKRWKMSGDLIDLGWDIDKMSILSYTRIPNGSKEVSPRSTRTLCTIRLSYEFDL